MNRAEKQLIGYVCVLFWVLVSLYVWYFVKL
jgi:hypothetical protein